MTQISLQNAEDSWPEILEKALKGEVFIIERDGKPVAKLAPISPGEDWIGMDDGEIWIADDFDATPEEFFALTDDITKS